MLRPVSNRKFVSDSKFVVALGWLAKYSWFAVLGCFLVLMFSTAMGQGSTVLQWFIDGSEVLARLILLVGCAAMSMVLLESIR